MLAFEELSFAENFTTSARVGLIWNISVLEFSIELACWISLWIGFEFDQTFIPIKIELKHQVGMD